MGMMMSSTAKNHSDCVPYHPLPPPPAFGEFFPLAYIVAVLAISLILVIIALKVDARNKNKTCAVRQTSKPSPKPIDVVGVLTVVFGLVGAVGIIFYWCTFFTSASTMVV